MAAVCPFCSIAHDHPPGVTAHMACIMAVSARVALHGELIPKIAADLGMTADHFNGLVNEAYARILEVREKRGE